MLCQKAAKMNKYLRQLFLFALIAGSTIYGMEQTMPTTSVSVPVCNDNLLSCDQAKSLTVEIDKIISPLMLNAEQKEQLTSFIIEQAQQQIKTKAMNQNWFARHKTFLICTALCAITIATHIMWFVVRQKTLKKTEDQNSAEQNNNDAQQELEITRSNLENIRKEWATTRAARDALEIANNQLRKELSSGSSNRELEIAQGYAATLRQKNLELQEQLRQQQTNQQLQAQITKLQLPAASTQP